MIKRLQHRYIQRILSVIGKSVCKTGIVTALCLLFPVCSFALPAEHYASSSALSEGKWVRVEISGEGLKFISNSALRQMGFSNPSEVNVYGYGGGMLSENLNASQPDDLPVQTLTRTADGIIFYAADNIVWTTPITFGFPYSHTKNLYAETSYYFLSDRPLNSELPAVVDMKARSGVEEINKFKAPLLHEQDIALASNTGAIYLGEDFRSTVTRKFTFQLTGNVGKEVSARVNFGALNTATTYLAFKANGVNLPKGENDRVSGGSASSEVFIRRGTPVKTFDCNSEKLDFEINYSYSGVISTARLDYIEVVYDRAMTLAGDQMIITHIVDDPVTFVVSGVDNATEIWDVTDPAKVKKISYSISGTTCKFTVDDKGLRRFAVFNPSKVTTGIKESKNISNQDIHALETPDYLIITPSEYRQAAEQLAECHRRRGLTVTVLDPESIYNEFASGNPDVTAFRKLLKMWYDRAGEDGRAPKYCMIFSRPTFDNKKVSTEVANCGYPRLPIWNNPSIETGAYSFSTDDYIGMLEDSDTFDIQGPNPISVAVGRFAVTSVKEAEEMVNKTIKYIERPEYGSWRNNITFIADDQNHGDHISQCNKVIDATRKVGNGKDFTYTRLYTDAYPLVYTGTGPTYPEPKRQMFRRFNDSAVISYAGHANPRSWTHENLFTWTDMQNLTNTNLPFLLGYTCEYLRWDDNEISGAEVVWKHPASGFIGMIVPSRTVYMSWNLNFNLAMANHLFERNKDGSAKTWGEVMVSAKNERLNESGYRGNTLKYAFLGDPALPLLSPVHRVELERIGDISVADIKSGELPELGARASAEIEGNIVAPDGSVDAEFNGVLDIILFDAEVPVTTNGNGTDGEEMSYNDRKTKLFNTRARVENGHWKTTIRIPLEIENNYSPAMLAFYAYSDNGVEANGTNESLYVYGYDESVESDTEGPEIMFIGLNSRNNFSDGMIVSPNPVFFATLRDDSGINLSDAGIGHKITLTLDDRTVYDDVARYFSPDVDEDGKGSLVYPLSDIEPGQHTATLVVWDNANNSTSSSIRFQVGIGVNPNIYDVKTDANPATTGVNFKVLTDQALSQLEYNIEVFDLSGRCVWSSLNSGSTDLESSMTTYWNLQDSSGHRVPRGIYLYRAKITTPQGMTQTKTKKLAVAAP